MDNDRSYRHLKETKHGLFSSGITRFRPCPPDQIRNRRIEQTQKTGRNQLRGTAGENPCFAAKVEWTMNSFSDMMFA